MAIKILTYDDVINNNHQQFQIELNNGDLRVLNEIVDSWNFKNKQSALRFALAILKITNPGELYQSKEGKMCSLLPTDQISRGHQDG